jgi:predicted DNA binding protein
MRTTTEATTEGETETEAGTIVETVTDGSAVVAEFAIPVGEFALRGTIAALDGVAFEIERVVVHDGDGLAPLVWASGCERDALESALTDDPTVGAFDLLAGTGDGAKGELLCRTEWSDRVDVLARSLVEEGGTILAATTAKGRWTIRLLLPEREALARTYETCTAAGLTLDLTRVYALEEGKQGRLGLTDEQEEALELAFDHGYYGIPRGTMAKGLADELEISHQALSERLRRAHGNLVENTIALGRSGDPQE